MTCPNCGADLERRAFMFICSYCGSTIADNEHNRTTIQDEEETTSSFYDYVTRHYDYIQQSPFVNIQHNGRQIECTSAPPFYANDGHFHLDKTLGFCWRTYITPLGIRFALLAYSPNIMADSYLCFKIGDKTYKYNCDSTTAKEAVFSFTFDEFLMFCVVEDFELYTNICDSSINNSFHEFITYTRRFFHYVLNRNKFRYAIDVTLLTD